MLFCELKSFTFGQKSVVTGWAKVLVVNSGQREINRFSDLEVFVELM